MVIGYARVSRVDQHLEFQLDALRRAGCERIYTDKATGESGTRYHLRRALDVLREGEVLVVWALEPLARNLSRLLRVGTDLSDRGVKLRSLKKDIDTRTAARAGARRGCFTNRKRSPWPSPCCGRAS